MSGICDMKGMKGVKESGRMEEGLSKRGLELLRLCEGAAEVVTDSIQDLIGTEESGRMVQMGADGTPTKRIDRAAENAVLEALASSGLSFRVLSEEIGEVSIGNGSDPDYFLHLDPLDGTFNAICGIPFYSVSIYLSSEDLQFGYIGSLAQAKGTGFYAEAGRGAYSRPGGRLCVSKQSDIRQFSITAYTLRPHTHRITGVGDVVRRIRTLGSTSLEMALVASGRLDAFVDLRGMMRVVDIAAGKLILEEASGCVTDEQGRGLLLDGDMWQKRMLIGSNGERHRELLGLIGGGED